MALDAVRKTVFTFVWGFGTGFVLVSLLLLLLNAVTRPGRKENHVNSVARNHEKYLDVKSSMALELDRKIRVLCMVMSTPENDTIRAVHINATWGQRCNTLLFITPKGTNSPLPVVELDLPDGDNNMWPATMAAFKYVFENHADDADWFFKADDDTFAIMENLRHLLRDYDPNEPLQLGRRFMRYPGDSVTYMAGGAGYVLSREALRRLVTIGFPDSRLCPRGLDTDREDILMGMCVHQCGIRLVDTRDWKGRHRFMVLAPFPHLFRGPYADAFDEFLKQDFYPSSTGSECCSAFSITFHFIPPELMSAMEYVVYRLKIFGNAVNYVRRL